MKQSLIRSAIVILFILLFLYTGITKVAGYSEYITEIRQSPFLKLVPPFVAWVPPVLEITVALMLATARWRRRGLYLCCLLMTLFTIYLVGLSQFSDYIPCSCGGFIDTLPRGVHIILNCILLLLSILGIVLQKKQKALYKSSDMKYLS